MINKKKNNFLKIIGFRILYPALEKYLSKERNFNYKGIPIVVFPGVFHPEFFFSTKLLLQYLDKINFNKKYVLELGAGTGLISIFAARKGGYVTASDINLTAVYNIEKNVKMTNANVEVVHSDLFDDIPQRRYDYIIVNPPYYQKTYSSEKEFASLGGDDFQYFRKLFSQLGNNYYENTKVIMIISDEADLEMINSVAKEFNFVIEVSFHKNTWGENHFIFRVKSTEIVQK